MTGRMFNENGRPLWPALNGILVTVPLLNLLDSTFSLFCDLNWLTQNEAQSSSFIYRPLRKLLVSFVSSFPLCFTG